MQNAPREHSTILSTLIKLPFVFKILVSSIFEWPLKTGFTVWCISVLLPHISKTWIWSRRVLIMICACATNFEVWTFEPRALIFQLCLISCEQELFKTFFKNISLTTDLLFYSYKFNLGLLHVFRGHLDFTNTSLVILKNSAGIDEMAHSVAIHLGHHCLPKYCLGQNFLLVDLQTLLL